jgi:single-strand DNA-binding protein
VYLEGQLQTRKWTDTASGQEKYSTEVVLNKYRGELTMLDGKGENAGGAFAGSGGSLSDNRLSDAGSDSYMGSFNTPSPAGGATMGGSQTLLDDEIPF